MSFPEYLLKVNLAILICWALYRLAFRKFSFFQWNRFYLLGSVVLSLLLPLITLPRGGQLVAVAELNGINWDYVDHLVQKPLAVTFVQTGVSARVALLVVYLIGTLTLFIACIRSYLKIRRQTAGAMMVEKGTVKVYVHQGQNGSFTLFRKVYLDKYTWESGMEHVLQHEGVHASQLHSIDSMIITFVGVFLWFNPFVFLLLRYSRENHEYLADEHALDGPDALGAYLACLRDETIRRYSPGFASYFKSSTIKKRIIMLTNHHTKSTKKWRYLAIIPTIALILVAFQASGEQSFNSPGKVIKTAPGVYKVPAEGNIPSVFPLPEEYRERISWGFNETAIHPINKKETTHMGVDIPAPEGTPVFASADGVVKKAVNLKGWGNLVVLEHQGGYVSFYAHLKDYTIEAGGRVEKGQVIGRVGNTGQSTGPHLHYEVRKGETQLNPSDYY